MRVLIAGCGYIGRPLGTELARQGHEVFGIRRTAAALADLAAAGIQGIQADISQRGDLDAIPLPFDWVVHCAAAGGGDIETYRRVYLEGNRNLLDWLEAVPPKKYVYTSSTGVYGQNDGSLVKESSPTAPDSETGRVLVEAEQALLAAAHRPTPFPAIILRVAGIYGPERTRMLELLARREARIPGQGLRCLNMIHRDDVVGCLVAALKSGRAGEVYNAVDDEPVPQVHFYRWLSETLGISMPPFGDEEPAGARSRGATHKKVSNRKLKMELGCVLKYPTFRQGYTAEIQRLDREDKLEIKPEPR